MKSLRFMGKVDCADGKAGVGTDFCVSGSPKSAANSKATKNQKIQN